MVNAWTASTLMLSRGRGQRRGHAERDEASRAAGVRLVRVAPGQAEMTMMVTLADGERAPHRARRLRIPGADTAFAVACNSYGAVTVAAGCDIDFVAPAHEGDELTATAVERTRFGRNGLYDVAVRRADGKVVAEMRGRSRTLRRADDA
jgi:acyl-CoA thioesterase